jgi:hypothetical protein
MDNVGYEEQLSGAEAHLIFTLCGTAEAVP